MKFNELLLILCKFSCILPVIRYNSFIPSNTPRPKMNLNTESTLNNVDANLETPVPFVTLTPESEARGIRFPTEDERANLLSNLSNLTVASDSNSD